MGDRVECVGGRHGIETDRTTGRGGRDYRDVDVAAAVVVDFYFATHISCEIWFGNIIWISLPPAPTEFRDCSSLGEIVVVFVVAEHKVR